MDCACAVAVANTSGVFVAWSNGVGVAVANGSGVLVDCASAVAVAKISGVFVANPNGVGVAFRLLARTVTAASYSGVGAPPKGHQAGRSFG